MMVTSHYRQSISLFFYCLLLMLPCSLANVVPVSTSPPSGLAPAETPQMILITFDDAVNAAIFSDILTISAHQNPDGSPAAFTFFISTDYTDYWLVHRLHAAGHEIAVHTITHSTGDSTTFDTWVREIEGCRESLSRLASIPLADIRGFRAPFLKHNSAMFEALARLGFDYDSSIPEVPGLHSPDGENYIWPYTLHDGIKQNMWSGTGPDQSLPDFFEVPMWNLLDGETRHNMDPSGSREDLVELFKSNFLMRYEGNRAPWGLWLHASSWLTNQEHVEALNEFLDWALAKPDVWVVGAGTLVDWMRNPVSAESVEQQGVLRTHTYTAVTEEATYSNNFPEGRFRSVGARAAAYPTLEKAFMRNVEVSDVDLEWEVVNQWGTGFQAEIRIIHELSRPLSDWKMKMSLGQVEITGAWGGASYKIEDGCLHITPGHAGAAIPEGETTVLTIGATGSPESLGQPQGTLKVADFLPPRMSIAPALEDGSFKLQWNRVAPVYKLQKRTCLQEGDWQTVETYFGQEETIDTSESSSAFYRLQAVH